MGETGVKMIRTVLATLVLASLAACAPTSSPAPVAERPVATAPPPMPMPVREPKDSCGAREMQSLVGKPRTEIPVPVNPANRRVSCTTCPVTMDYRPERLNIIFDAKSGLVTEVKCG
jgi:hypothetical protein